MILNAMATVVVNIDITVVTSCSNDTLVRLCALVWRLHHFKVDKVYLLGVFGSLVTQFSKSAVCIIVVKEA
jgi:hypothetical protein